MIEEKTAEAKEAKAAETEMTGIMCDKCGSPMIVKRGRFGKFVACSNFPTCRYTEKIAKDKKEEEEKEKKEKG